ncbi:hypothetical protein MLD38_006619 [Melastoma candidum]|uniref:Uncharacterized protein n=1 Tax=Melastoma candidum TaxID=119954 RepID=A0ACB9RQC4_9MYRT|nr:hypothetical protein MLD38_006619 [Melastoma candidum]
MSPPFLSLLLFFFFFFFFFPQLLSLAFSEPSLDRQYLLAFLSSVPHSSRLRWDPSSSACSWVGVFCDPTNSSVLSLRLPGAALLGPLPTATLGRLSSLRVLSLRSNRISSPLPPDLSNLTHLRSLYLQDNNLSGQFPDSLLSLSSLSRLDLSSNRFSGSLPSGLANLTRLTRLYLQDNDFSGALPSIDVTGSITSFNVSNNALNGSIPDTLSKFPSSAFAGNLALCGSPLPSCFTPSPQPRTKSKKKLSTAAIIGIIVGCVLAFLLLLVVLLLCLRKRKRRPTKPPKAVAARAGGVHSIQSAEAGTSSSKDDITGGSVEAAERNKLVFLEGGVYSFDLEDLLRASAEVLGKGSIGTYYKAVLEEGTTVVVKRLKDVVVGKMEFDSQMEVLGRIGNRHDNVLGLRAYYYSKDEKLLVSDYVPAGSLSVLLHGSRGSGRTPLDWDSRLKIAICTGKGLVHLHTSGKIAHGNIKSSNVLLRADHVACVSDYGLNPLFGTTTPPNRVAGYRAPEVVETRKVTLQSDVYSFGVLLLELLTGKSPNQASLGEEGIDLPRWVQSVVREEWTAEVFDVELMRYKNIEEEMVQLLQIAMSCVAIAPDQRPAMVEVVRMMEEMNRDETDEGLRQYSDDPSRESDGQTPPTTESRTTPPPAAGITP